MINCRKRNKKEIHSLFQLQLLSQLCSRLYMTTPLLTSCQLTHAKAMWGNWHQSGLSFLMPKPWHPRKLHTSWWAVKQLRRLIWCAQKGYSGSKTMGAKWPVWSLRCAVMHPCEMMQLNDLPWLERTIRPRPGPPDGERRGGQTQISHAKKKLQMSQACASTTVSFTNSGTDFGGWPRWMDQACCERGIIVTRFWRLSKASVWSKRQADVNNPQGFDLKQICGTWGFSNSFWTRRSCHQKGQSTDHHARLHCATWDGTLAGHIAAPECCSYSPRSPQGRSSRASEIWRQHSPDPKLFWTIRFPDSVPGSRIVCRRFDALMQSGSDVQFFFAQYHGRVWGGVVPLACCVRFGIQSNHTCGTLPTQTWPNVPPRCFAAWTLHPLCQLDQETGVSLPWIVW